MECSYRSPQAGQEAKALISAIKDLNTIYNNVLTFKKKIPVILDEQIQKVEQIAQTVANIHIASGIYNNHSFKNYIRIHADKLKCLLKEYKQCPVDSEK